MASTDALDNALRRIQDLENEKREAAVLNVLRREIDQVKAALESEKRDRKEHEIRAALEREKLRAALESEKRDRKEQELKAQIEKQIAKADVDRKLLEERVQRQLDITAALEKAAMLRQMENIRTLLTGNHLSRSIPVSLHEAGDQFFNTFLPCTPAHAQATGGDQANSIYLELERMGFAVWYDNRADDLTKEGMLKGIELSAAFILFLSNGVLTRPYCQMEIRHALALSKPMVLIYECDARFGSYDFREARAAAPSDLQAVLDCNEALPFRRRGYERDGMLLAVVERANFAQIYVAAQEGAGSKADKLATLPSTVAHFALDALFERPVQAQLVELLLLPGGDSRYACCVLVHGMGGTGKTVTAVAAVQDTAVRRWFSEIYWLTVGADAVGAKIKALQAALYRQIEGTTMNFDGKDEHERQTMLFAAMAKKQQRVLLVLDDPWVPEQVRFLNPIDGSESHRVLITTRLRHLVPKAIRLELPLMDEDEAVGLLLELANIDKAKYSKDNPRSAWPPPAAYTIAAECGLLPITLTIAAQVVRSWGRGWERAVLPLLREQEGSGGLNQTSTAEERVIGAGLKALAKHKDGAALTSLFHMFGVTLEDFVHSMPVIELLWRSCCASDAEKQESNLTTRLKVRQWTQLLVDHALLLGSSSEGIHLHDVVLQHLRKRLSEEEMRAEHRKVVEGMIAASAARKKATGQGLQDSGPTAKAWDGEEVDW
eukprot:g2835.t1